MSEKDPVVFGRVARSKRPAERVKVNKAGTISVLSIVRNLKLADDTQFDVRISRRRKTITLVPVGATPIHEATPVVEETPETPPTTDG